MKKMWLVWILPIMMLSCGGATPLMGSPTPEVVSPSLTPNAAAALLPGTAIPVIASPTMKPPDLPQATQKSGGPFSAIIVRMVPGSFVLLGGTENGEWLSPETVVPHLGERALYQIYGAGGTTGTARGKRPVMHQICQEYQVETDSYPLGGQAVGVTGTWNVVPRLAQEIPYDNPTYVDALNGWLRTQNITEPTVEISQILRVDIEGDGTEEVLINGSHFTEPSGHSVMFGDYSLVVMRKVVGNSVVTLPLVADYYYEEVENQFPLTYTGLLTADLNNDGILEVLVGIERWEGAGVIVYEVEGTNIREIFRNVCGL